MPSDASPVRSVRVGATALIYAPSIDSVTICEGYSVSVNGLTVHGQPTFEQSEHAGLILCTAEKGIQFAIGDYANYLEERFGERASQIIDAGSGWSRSTVESYRWCASRIASERRRMDKLTIRHHLLVAALTPAQQGEWLSKAADAEDGPWTVARLRAAINEGEDLPGEDFYVLAKAASAEQRDALLSRLVSEGYGCKAVTRRQRKASS